MGLGINVNVANCAFWLSQDFEQLVREYVRAYQRQWDQSKLLAAMPFEAI